MTSFSHERPIIVWQNDPQPQPPEPNPYDCGGSDCACSTFLPMVPHQEPSDPRTSLGDIEMVRSSSCKIIRINDKYHIVLGEFNPPVLMNNRALDILNSFTTPTTLTALGYACEEESQNAVEKLVEVGIISRTIQGERPVGKTNTLISWLHISDRCNLRCTYCYLAHLPQDMSLQVGMRAVEASFRSATNHGFSKVQLKYAGGEPLLRFPYLVKLHHYAQQIASRANIALDGVILSNGTLLTDSIVATIQSLKLRLMVSLDGLGRIHDSQRPYAGGHGSAADVLRGIDLALSLGLRPYVSITISNQNAHGLPNLISWILDRGLSFNLNFYRENEKSKSHSTLKLEEKTIIDGMLQAFKVIETNLPNRSLLDSLVDLSDLSAPHHKTCGVGENYLVFDQHGRVSMCQMHQHYQVGDIDSPDPLNLIRADELGIRNFSVNEKEGCKSCDWKLWCTGGCPLLTFRATGRYDLNSPNCNIYKTLYPAAVRLEGLRLLKYYSQHTE